MSTKQSSRLHHPDGTLLRCDCGSTKPVAFSPGHEPERTLVGRLESAERTQAWCANCWIKRFGVTNKEVA